VTVTRDDLVGQYIRPHRSRKPAKVAQARNGRRVVYDEAYYLYRPENERDYGRKRLKSCCRKWKTTAMIWS